jgi:hypothetical protein
MNGRIERLAPLAGVVAMVLGVAALILWGTQPSFSDDSAAKIASYLESDTGRHMVGTWLDIVAGGFILWFAACLRVWLADHEGGSHRLSNLAFGAVVAAQACFWIGDGIQLSLFARADDNTGLLSPAAAATMFDAAGFITWVAGALALGVGFAAVALVALRHAAMPRWLGIATAVVAVLLVAPLLSWIGLFVSGPWVLVTSIWLYRAMSPATAAEPPAVTPAPPAAPAAA